jgi:hypothetical protein
MAYQRETKVGVGTPPNRVNETMPGGPLVTTQDTTGYSTSESVGTKVAGTVKPRSALEKIGFWVIAIAALVILVVLAGVILPPLVGGIISATYISSFVAFLTLMNLKRPSGWANAVLGRRVFPVLAAGQDGDVWRLAGVNAVLVFLFSFFYSVFAGFIGPFFGGIAVFFGLIVLGIFYNRARRVVIKP